MRWWHRLIHDDPIPGDVCPSKKYWVVDMRVIQSIACSCGKVWQDDFIVRHRSPRKPKTKRPKPRTGTL